MKFRDKFTEKYIEKFVDIFKEKFREKFEKKYIEKFRDGREVLSYRRKIFGGIFYLAGTGSFSWRDHFSGGKMNGTHPRYSRVARALIIPATFHIG